MQGKTRLSRRCAKSVQKCAEPQKLENPTRNLTILRVILVRSRELESLALWLKEPLRLGTLILKLSSFRFFLQSIVIFHCIISAPLVVFCKSEYPLHPLKPCKNSAETVHLLWDKWKMIILTTDLMAVWVTTKVNLIRGKKNAHSSEEFSGEWAFSHKWLI